MMARLHVGQRVEITASGYAGREGTIMKISDDGQYQDVRADNGAMIYLAGQLKPATPELVEPDRLAAQHTGAAQVAPKEAGRWKRN